MLCDYYITNYDTIINIEQQYRTHIYFSHVFVILLVSCQLDVISYNILFKNNIPIYYRYLNNKNRLTMKLLK